MTRPVIFATYLGLVITHFLLDAKIWRLREPVQRAVIRKRLSFAFAR